MRFLLLSVHFCGQIEIKLQKIIYYYLKSLIKVQHQLVINLEKLAIRLITS